MSYLRLRDQLASIHRTRKRRSAVIPETLEERVLLAGNILVSFDAELGLLQITGDDEDNRFNIDRGTLSPATGTTVNGSSDDIFFEEEIRDINIEMGGGSDFVLLQLNPVANDVAFRGGSGDDGLILWGAEIGGDLSIKTGRGNDTISVGRNNGFTGAGPMGDVGGGVRIKTGSGDDIVALGGSLSQFGQTGFAIGENLVVKTGKGNDQVGFADSTVAGEMIVKMGAGSDEFHSVGGDMGDDLTVKLGRGDDWAYMDDTVVGGVARIKGGAGLDNGLEENGTYEGEFVSRRIEGSEVTVDVAAFQDHIFVTFWNVWD